MSHSQPGASKRAAPQTILLTGASGFVGRQVVRSLRDRGRTLRLVGRSTSLATIDGGPGDIVPTADLFAENIAWWRDACDGVDAVIHLAWYVEPGRYLDAACNLDCLSGTLKMAQGAAAARVSRFVGIGTCLEYDLAGGRVDIDSPLLPQSVYAGAKAATFISLSNFCRQNAIEFGWCRLFYLHGMNENLGRLVPYLHRQLSAGQPAELSEGHQRRDYLDVREAGEMIADFALSARQGPFNICSGKAVTVRALAESIADEYGRRDLLKFGARAENPSEPFEAVGIRREIAHG